MKVYFLHGAEEDLKDLRRYILRAFGELSWQDSYTKTKETIRLLQSTPESGSVPDELADLQIGRYRQLLSGMNRILYEIREDAIYIHIVCDSRKDMRTLLSRRLLRAPPQKL